MKITIFMYFDGSKVLLLSPLYLLYRCLRLFWQVDNDINDNLSISLYACTCILVIYLKRFKINKEIILGQYFSVCT